MVRMVPHKLVGIDNPVYLPEHLKVSVEIVGSDKCGWVRSCTANALDYTTWHDTGSPGSRARSERNYLHNGPRNADGTRRLVGYNGAVDDVEFIQLTPFDETTWAAGTANGNRLSAHIEQCYGGGINFEKSFDNAAAVHGGIIAAHPGWKPIPSIKKHQDWSGKWCPAQILNAGRWPKAVERVVYWHGLAIAAASGDQPQPEPEPGEDTDVEARLFGSVMHDGKRYAHDPNGPVTQAWETRGARIGRYPRLVDVFEAEGARWFVFSDGAVAKAVGSTITFTDEA